MNVIEYPALPPTEDYDNTAYLRHRIKVNNRLILERKRHVAKLREELRKLEEQNRNALPTPR